MAKREPRLIAFAEIEQMFSIAGMYRRSNDMVTVVQVKPYPQEFLIDTATGEVIAAPRGFAKVFRPGRIDLTELRQAYNRHADRQWFFTFGFGHQAPDGTPLRDRFVVILGPYEAARTAMLERFGDRWSMQYHPSEKACSIDWYGLTQYGETIYATHSGVTPEGYVLSDAPADDVPPNAGSTS